jgi:hypothetical protein
MVIYHIGVRDQEIKHKANEGLIKMKIPALHFSLSTSKKRTSSYNMVVCDSPWQPEA